MLQMASYRCSLRSHADGDHLQSVLRPKIKSAAMRGSERNHVGAHLNTSQSTLWHNG